MENLTEVLRPPLRGRSMPLYLEMPVNDDLEGPFLVSGSKAPFIWGQRTDQNVVRVGVRSAPLDVMHAQVVTELRQRASEDGWEANFDATDKGLAEASLRLEAYQIPKPYVLIIGDGEGAVVFAPTPDIIQRTEKWVHSGQAVLIPQDRSFLGTTLTMGTRHHAMIIHNASRGICFLGGQD